MMWSYIRNPESGKRVKVNGKVGRKVLRNYLIQAQGGAIRSMSRMPSCGAYKGPVSQEGGSRGQTARRMLRTKARAKAKKARAKARKASNQAGGGCEGDSDCSPHKDGRKKICNSKSGRCVLETGKAGKEELGRRGSTSSSKKTSPKKKKPSPKKKQTSAKKTKVKKMIKKGISVHPKLLKATHTRVPKNKAAKKAAAEKRLADDCEMIKSSKKGDRISAKCYYDTFGKESTIGDKCSPAYSGGEGCLRLDKNGRPRWAKCNDTDAQTACRYSQ